MPKPKKPFKIHPSADGQWVATIQANNGQTLFTSETYKEKDSAVNAFNAVAKVFLANHPTEEQIAQFLLGYLTDPNNDNAASANRANAERFAREFLQHFRTVQDRLTEYVHVEKRKKQEPN